MLTGLKVSSLARKHVFYRPEHNAKGGDPIKLNFLNLLKCGCEIYEQTELKE